MNKKIAVSRPTVAPDEQEKVIPVVERMSARPRRGASAPPAVAPHDQTSAAAIGHEHVSTLFETVPLPLFFSSFDGVLLDLNPAAEALLGANRAQFIGVNVWETDAVGIDDAHLQRIRDAWDARQAVWDVPMRIHRRNGETRLIRKRFEPFTLNGVDGMLCVAIDVTERQATENALLEAEERFTKAFRSSPMAMLLGWYDGTLIDVNLEAEIVTGYSREELIGQKPAELGIWYYPTDSPRTKVLERFEREGQIKALSANIIRKNGEWRDVYVSSERILIGETPAILSLVLDVTDQRETEEALASSEERFQKAFNASPSAIAISSLENSVISDVNERFLSMFGGTREQIIGSTGTKLNLWGDREERKRAYDAIRRGERYTSGLTTFRRLNGGAFPGIFTFDAIQVSGSPRSLIHIQDLTDLESLRADLAQGETRVRTLLSHSRDIVGILNADDTVELISDNAAQFLGYESLSPDEIVSPKLHSLSDIDLIAAVKRDVLEEPNRTRRVEHRIKRGDGDWQWVETTLTNLTHEPSIGGILFTIHDMTDRRSAEEELRIRDRATSALSSGFLIIDSLDPNFPITSINPAYARMIGVPEEALISQPLAHFAEQYLTDESQEQLRQAVRSEVDVNASLQHRRPDGSLFWTDADFSPVRDQTGTITHYVGILQDVTERLTAEEELRLRSLLLDEAPAAIFAITRDGVITHWNTQAEAIFGWPRAQAIGAGLSELTGRTSFHMLARTMLDRANQGKRWEGEAQLAVRDGHEIDIQATSTPIDDLSGHGPGMVAVIVDISDRKLAEAEFQRLAHNDPLTSLANRSRFVDRMQIAISALGPGETAAVFFINLDQVRALNESLGHEHGDEAMRLAAHRLVGVVGSSGLVARFSGDTFSVVVNPCSAQAAAELARQMHESLQHPFDILGRKRFTGGNIGYTLANPGESVSQILSEADTAQREARLRHLSGPVTFEASMAAAAQRRLDLETDLRQAVAASQFVLHFQPIVSLSARTIVAAEALLRWPREDGGFVVSPGEFIPIAEEIGLIIPMGQWVLEEACRTIKRWDQTLGDRSAPNIHINISAAQFRQTDFADTVMATLRAHGITPDRITLEVTETAAMIDADQAIRQLKALRDIGVRLAIDDFGAGYSNLGLLNKLTVQTLKIDRSFAKGLETDPGMAAITRSLVAIGRDLGMNVTGEGIETADQADRLATFGCNRGQGYFFAHPMPERDFHDLLTHGPSLRLPR